MSTTTCVGGGRGTSAGVGSLSQTTTRSQLHTAVHVALRLRLQTIALHDVLEGTIVSRHLRHHVHGAHDELVEMAALHQLDVIAQSVLETRPHLRAQRRVDAQTLAQVAQTNTGHVIHLAQEERERAGLARSRRRVIVCAVRLTRS